MAQDQNLELEYNNRARVPEHPAIFDAWLRRAAVYRTLALEEGRAELGLGYGNSQRQRLDLFWAGRNHGKLALFVHGGYWRSLDIDSFSHMAGGLNAHGVSVAIAGYDLCPAVGIGEIIAQIRHACVFLWRRFGLRLMVYGHSAGGHLAACMLTTPWRDLSADLPDDLVPAACAISGLFDLTPLLGLAMNADLRLDASQARRLSPLFFAPPRGRALDLLVGAEESSEFLRQSRALAQSWGQAGVKVHLQEIEATNHFTVIDAIERPESLITVRLAALADRAAAASPDAPEAI